MIKKIINQILLAATLLTVVLTGCKKDGMGSSSGQLLSKDDAAFAKFEHSLLNQLWKLNPDWGTSVGYHKYDSLLYIPNEQSRGKLLNFAKVEADTLSRFDFNTLSASNKIDHHILQDQLNYMQWQIQQLKSYEWDPSGYNVISTFAYILNEPYAPLDKRLRNFYQRMAFVPEYYKDAEKQIKNPVVELTSLAIEQNTGGLSVIEKDFADSLKKTKIPKAEQKLMTDRAAQCVTTITSYTDWLKALKNDHPRSFRLGKDLYEDKFSYETGSAISADKIYNAAVDRKKYLHTQMFKISQTLWPKYFSAKQQAPADSMALISKVIDTLSLKHVKPSDFQSAIEQTIPSLPNL